MSVNKLVKQSAFISLKTDRAKDNQGKRLKSVDANPSCLAHLFFA